MMRNRMRIAKNIMFKGQKVRVLFRRPKMKDGGSVWETSGWIEIDNAFVVNHDFREWRPWQNINEDTGDMLEGYAQFQISEYDLKKVQEETGFTFQKDTKIEFQGQVYSVQGLEQFRQRDMLVYDLKRIYE